MKDVLKFVNNRAKKKKKKETTILCSVKDMIVKEIDSTVKVWDILNRQDD